MNPPDTSRGHVPILALFLANPGRALTADEIREHLPTLSEKSLVTSLGQLRFSGALIRTGTQYTAATPFPPSRRERHTERERERRAAHRAANPAPRTPIPKADTGYTSAAARKARQDETIRKRAAKSAALQDQMLAILLTDPKRRWSDSELFAQLTGAAALKRQALSTLMVDNRLHYACSPLVDKRGYEYWSAQPVPTPAKPIKYTRTHIELHALLTRSTYTLGSLARRAERAMTISQKRVLVLVEELRCGGYASYHPVGATVIVRPGPAPTITQESAHASAA
ncbi:hypothetical protein [Deinococcus sp. UR1]|uniref:hypothetical protein n=1 Tax=Deinococcus sp. UR1 TaxID=1704277 RepID=UPI0011AF7C96|nr:hypothetical protein [Deinococcus sp. UR1]